VRVLPASVVGVLLLSTLGWRVTAPVDPELAVTLARSPSGVLSSWPTVLVLTMVVAGLGTALSGRRVPLAGLFAAGVGLAALALRGGSMQHVLAYWGSNEASGRRALMLTMAWDCVLWGTILGASWAVALTVRGWLWPGGSGPFAAGEASATTDSVPPPAVAARQTGGSKRRAADAGQQGSPVRRRAGWPALVATSVLAAFFIWLTIARTPVAQIARGQVIASVAGGLFLAAMATRYFTGIDEAHWYALAPLAVALLGYALGYLSADMSWAQRSSEFKYYALLSTTPPHDLVRPLPLEYLAVGVAGALSGFWTGERIEHSAQEGTT